VDYSELDRALAADSGRPEDLSIAYLSQCVVDASFPAASVAVRFKESGLHQEAAFICRQILAVEPENAIANFELAILLMRDGQLVDASIHADRAARNEPENLRFASTYAATLAAMGDRGALEALEGFAWSGSPVAEPLWAETEFIRFLLDNPRDATLARLRRTADRYLTTSEVSDLLFDAVHGQKPFALVRAGDGEGAWTFRPYLEEARFSHLYRHMRGQFLLDWFGSEHLLDSVEFHRFAQENSELLSEADIVGVPPAGRVEHEYGLMSTRGIPSCINLLKSLGCLDGAVAASPRYLCSAHIHTELQGAGFFSRLFEEASAIGVVTSFSTLSTRLRALGARVDIEYLVPGDSRNFWTDHDGTQLCQFPERVAEVMQSLSTRDLRGHVFLVAAGFVGKRYCLGVKARGGVAIDVGALANHWGSGEASGAVTSQEHA
jgi:hypothetical protein